MPRIARSTDPAIASAWRDRRPDAEVVGLAMDVVRLLQSVLEREGRRPGIAANPRRERRRSPSCAFQRPRAPRPRPVDQIDVEPITIRAEIVVTHAGSKRCR